MGLPAQSSQAHVGPWWDHPLPDPSSSLIPRVFPGPLQGLLPQLGSPFSPPHWDALRPSQPLQEHGSPAPLRLWERGYTRASSLRQGLPSPGSRVSVEALGLYSGPCVSADVTTCWPFWPCAAWAVIGTSASCSTPRTSCKLQPKQRSQGPLEAECSSRRLRCPPLWTCSSPVSSAPAPEGAGLRWGLQWAEGQPPSPRH